MTIFVKYSAVSIAIQVGLTVALVLVTHGSVLERVISFYYPTIFAITKLGGFSGESTMMLPVFLGISLGILLYGVIFGLLATILKRT
jgi:hypothetical protein